jgi:hypothetical protein
MRSSSENEQGEQLLPSLIAGVGVVVFAIDLMLPSKQAWSDHN